MKEKNPEDMKRSIMIDCCRDGTITFRRRGTPSFNGAALPVFSVDTEEQAKTIQTYFCRVHYVEHPKMPGKPWYALTEFSGEVEDLFRVRKMFSKWFNKHFPRGGR